MFGLCARATAELNTGAVNETSGPTKPQLLIMWLLTEESVSAWCPSLALGGLGLSLAQPFRRGGGTRVLQRCRPQTVPGGAGVSETAHELGFRETLSRVQGK